MDYITKTFVYSNRGVGIVRSKIDADVEEFLLFVSATYFGGITVSAENDMTVVIILYSTDVAPIITTQAVTAILSTTATGNGDITTLGVPAPTAHGVCWDTAEPPTTAHSSSDEGAASSTGAFTSSITGLSPSTTYFVRAYATNKTGTVYGNLVTFATTA